MMFAKDDDKGSKVKIVTGVTRGHWGHQRWEYTLDGSPVGQ